MPRLLIHAPNIHVGGGRVLLQEVLRAQSFSASWAQLDLRIEKLLWRPKHMHVSFVGRSLVARLWAEWRLRRTSRVDDVILCFNGLPPFFPIKGKVVVFIQNRLLIDGSSLEKYPFKVRARIYIERLWASVFWFRCSRFIVQTPSMAELLKRRIDNDRVISIVPFAAPQQSPGAQNEGEGYKFDFVYVASGEAHKNHRTLLAAWCLLAEAGYRPSLALTLDSALYPDLCGHIAHCVASHGLLVTNLGVLSDAEINCLYAGATSLIYPSTIESFGLPLIEAARYGLSILASELDYVRDIIEPKETFDPYSPLSIARAVRRHLGVQDRPLIVSDAENFIREVLK
mgnify:CR=1 FL=1